MDFTKWYHYLLYYGILLLVIVGFSKFAKADTVCSKHKIYCQILDNNPSMNKKEAMNLSNIIYRKTKKYNIDARLFTAILAQETMYKMVQGSCSTGYIKIDMEYLTVDISDEMRTKLRDYTNGEVTVCEDFGIGQVNYRNIVKFDMNKERLLTDLDYSVEMAAFMLYKTKKYFGKSGTDWWTRYNAASKDKRELYKNRVNRYY